MPRANRDVDEPDVELEVVEDPLDPLFPRVPNVVSRRGHRVRINITAFDDELIPANATEVRLDADVITYGPDRLGHNRHLFRHASLWGRETRIVSLAPGHRPPYSFYIIVPRLLGDDHLGQGPYDSMVAITPMGEGLRNITEEQERSSAESDDVRLDEPVEPKINIRFTSM
jgi:hypothetical protein